jgi:fibro-slime domain-containing protein
MDPNTGLLPVEYGDILGIPFAFTARPVAAPIVAPMPVFRVQAVRERAALEIVFPRVEGYRVDLPGPPNDTGSTDQNGSFQAAIFTGTLDQTSAGTITFGGDDDVFLVLNGQVVGQTGGVHPQYDTTVNVGTGKYSLEIFYTDRYPVAATAVHRSERYGFREPARPDRGRSYGLGFATLRRARKTGIAIA